MREITTHKLAGLNDGLRVLALDAPGAGGANHHYAIEPTAPPPGDADALADIQFQNGPIAEAGVNGISNEALLAVVIDRLECFQKGDYACDENASAVHHLEIALLYLQARTRERLARGVEGTSAK